jgi:hypothetical protein|tara:strand:+ start:467 stop:673 length:207 start_codon:yes stop_codon:yes gene_type:complete
MKNKKQKENKMKIELTKKEKDFLLDWLCDDLHLELEKRREQDEQSPIVRKYLPKIIKKLEKIERKQDE